LVLINEEKRDELLKFDEMNELCETKMLRLIN